LVRVAIVDDLGVVQEEVRDLGTLGGKGGCLRGHGVPLVFAGLPPIVNHGVQVPLIHVIEGELVVKVASTCLASVEGIAT
jgi:hypothetical protein